MLMDVQWIRIWWQNGNLLLSDVYVVIGGLCYEYSFVLYIYQIGFVFKLICCYSYDFEEGKVNGYSIKKIDVMDFE